MEDAAVEFLLENLKQLQLHHAHVISDDTKNQIQLLESNLCLFKRLLNYSTDRNRDEDETLKLVVKQIIQVVYKAEDAVDAIVSQAAEKGVAKYFKRAFDALATLPSVVQEVELIAAKVKEIYDHEQIDFSTLQTKSESSTRTEQKNLHENKVSTSEDYIVGFDKLTVQLLDVLTGKREEQDVICIIGEPGVGKTTIASHVFHHPKMAYEFPTRLWVYVSKNFRKKDVYLAMLRDLNCITEDMYNKTDGEIGQTLLARLEREKFFIVFDDLWSTEDWDDLLDVLPKSNTMSKILITSRSFNVCFYLRRNNDVHLNVGPLDQVLGWELLDRLTKFSRELHGYTANLEELGRSIVNLCQGLPLLIMLTGGILAKTASAGEIYETWKKVHKALKAHASGENTFENVVSLSYNMLPCYLRPCFLYMGMFPEDFEIPIQRLILLWIAEGFIQQKTGTTVSLEETAMEYLKELIDRKLVIIGKVGLTRRIKTCRLHDMIRDFCLRTAGEYFYQEIQEIAEPWTSALDMYRHISINSEVVSFLSSQPYGPSVRTFLHFLREETILPPENVSSIPDSFKLLRVLDAMSIRFTRFPFHLTYLVHMRYIALSSDFKILPEAISKIWNIQTLIVVTSSRTLEIKADIWKMNQLRHLETNASIILQKNTTGERIDDKGEKIQTLSNISPESCTQVFERSTNLKKLGIRGRLAILMDHNKDGSCPFDGLKNLHLLEKLKLLSDVFDSPSDSQLLGLPPPDQFPPKLKSLTLSYTFLDWKHMPILGMLENLEVLRLKNNAFVGECWEAADDGFCQLEILQVEYTNLVVWEASSTQFPKLKHLMLRNCEQVEALPLSLADVSSLQVIDLYRTTKSAAASAKKILAITKAKRLKRFTKGRQLELSIFPHDE